MYVRALSVCLSRSVRLSLANANEMASARSGVGMIQMYLSVYNAVLFMGWCAVFAAAVYALMMENLGAVYAATAPVLVYAQSAAVMECGRLDAVSSASLSVASR